MAYCPDRQTAEDILALFVEEEPRDIVKKALKFVLGALGKLDMDRSPVRIVPPEETWVGNPARISVDHEHREIIIQHEGFVLRVGMRVLFDALKLSADELQYAVGGEEPEKKD